MKSQAEAPLLTFKLLNIGKRCSGGPQRSPQSEPGQSIIQFAKSIEVAHNYILDRYNGEI